jgi:hypothetical protein
MKHNSSSNANATKQYKWDSPQEWLASLIQTRIKANDHEGVSELLMAIVNSGKLDSDDLQDIFQSDMDEDGYFTPDPAPIIAAMSRAQVVELLEGVSIECKDDETTEELREALLANVEDGTIPAEALE